MDQTGKTPSPACEEGAATETRGKGSTNPNDVEFAADGISDFGGRNDRKTRGEAISIVGSAKQAFEPLTQGARRRRTR